MNKLTFTKQTEKIAFVFFTLYFVYGLFYLPFVQYLVSLAIGGIAHGITDSAEIAVVCVLAANFIVPILSGRKQEGFENQINEPAVPIKRTSTSSQSAENYQVLEGVGSETSEGFADANDEDMSLDEKKKAKEEPSVGKSKPASTTETPSLGSKDVEKMAEMMKGILDKKDAVEPSKAKKSEKDAFEPSKAKNISEKGIPPVHQPQEKETFQETQNSGLFKLGQIPKDEKGGHHIDAGTTVMNAINALKPDQIKAMTMDTKQLIETQKSLMGMLQTFQPMVSEGKQMMETFQEMFSPAMGSSKPTA
jgi:hypothetical protein